MAEINRTPIGVMTYLTPTGAFTDKKGLEALKKTIDACLADREVNLVLDLSSVATVNGATLEALLDARDKLASSGGSIKVVNANQIIREIFSITGFADHVSVMEGA